MPQPPKERGDRSSRPSEELSPAEAEAAQRLSIADGRCETVLMLIADAEVAEAIRATCRDIEKALLAYTRERLARSVPACAPEIVRVCDAISAERS